MGRPTKLTPELAFLICEAIRNGTPKDVAARANGVTPASLYEWQKPCPGASAKKHVHGPGCEPLRVMRRESNGTGAARVTRIVPVEPEEFAEFSEQMARARAMCEALMVGDVARAAAGDWRAAFAILKTVRSSRTGPAPRSWADAVKVQAEDEPAMALQGEA